MALDRGTQMLGDFECVKISDLESTFLAMRGTFGSHSRGAATGSAADFGQPLKIS